MKCLINLIILCCVCTLLCYLQSCNPDPDCPDQETITTNISADDLSKVPYTGFDTLYFLNKNGDTCIVKGTGKQYRYNRVWQGGNPDCGGKPYAYQEYSIKFVPVKGNLEFTFTQKADSRLIYVNRLLYEVMFIGESYAIDGINLGSRHYTDSLGINGVAYRRLRLFLSEKRTGGFDTTYKLLYNKPFGILYMKSEKQNEEFSIIPKP